MSFRDELKDLLEDSKDPNIELPGGDFEDLPEGTYEAIIEDVEFKESNAGNLMFVWHFIIENGQYANRHHWKHQVLTSAENMKRLTTDLAKFGVDTTSMDSIENDIESKVVGAPVDIKITHSVAKSGAYKGQTFVNTSITAVEE